MNIKKFTPKDGLAGLDKAIGFCGGQSALAKALSAICNKKIYQAHIQNWLNRDEKVPAEYARPIEYATEGKIKCYEIRPDIYPPP